MTVSTERIAHAVREVLETAALEGERPSFLTAAQILERLPGGLRSALVAEYEVPRGAGDCFSAHMRVAQVASTLNEVERHYLDDSEPEFDSRPSTPGLRLVKGRYRVDSRAPPADDGSRKAPAGPRGTASRGP